MRESAFEDIHVNETCMINARIIIQGLAMADKIATSQNTMYCGGEPELVRVLQVNIFVYKSYISHLCVVTTVCKCYIHTSSYLLTHCDITRLMLS